MHGAAVGGQFLSAHEYQREASKSIGGRLQQERLPGLDRIRHESERPRARVHPHQPELAGRHRVQRRGGRKRRHSTAPGAGTTGDEATAPGRSRASQHCTANPRPRGY